MFLKLKNITRNIFSVQSPQTSADYVITFLYFKIHIRKPTPKNLFKNVAPNAVLIFEPQTHHGECLPSYIKYLNDLGFHVDLLLQRKLIDLDPLSRMPQDADYSVIPYLPKHCHKILQNKDLLKYKHIIIATAVFTYYPQKGVTQEFPIFNQIPSVYLIEHDTTEIDVHHERAYLDRGKVFTLWDFSIAKMLNPCYFGNVKITPKNPSSETIFITIGAFEGKRRNHLLLFESIEKLIDLKQKFHVIIIGRNQNAYNIPEKIKPFITITGYLTYPQMYDQIENADFLLTLLDSNNEEHNRYTSTGVTGSIQLILGFAKVPLIQKKFADFYGFNAQNALVYTDNLTDCMLEAIKMPKQKYKTCQEMLIKKQLEIFKKSENNLKEVFKQTS